MADDFARAVRGAARLGARRADAPLLLAVSGGLDSMSLLVAMAGVARSRVAAVATFDHGTGAAAVAAAGHVARSAASLGLPVVVGRMPARTRAPDGWEAAWRQERHAFLNATASSLGACVTTAHTEDDQVETVLMRILRGSGTRGLAGLEASSSVLRPFLGLRRSTLEAWLRGTGWGWVDDPGNLSSDFLRNRVRHDLLPALRAADPSLDASLLSTGRAAADWRRDVDALVARDLAPASLAGGGLSVASAELAGYDRDSLAMLWGSLAGRVGLALDRRGTHRLASFIMNGSRTGWMPLSGGWCVEARRDAYLLRRSMPAPDAPTVLHHARAVRWGRFHFRAVRSGEGRDEGACWSAWLPADRELRVRAWSAGDRLAPAGGQPRRRVTRYLSDAGLRGSERDAWPVVVTDDAGAPDVVWIPGVRRSDAATERSGRPVRHYVCERIAP